MLKNEKYTGIAKYKEYVFDNIVPAIITNEVFKEAQSELDRHRHKNKARLVDYKFLLKHQCDAKPIKKDELEDFVVKSAMEYILSPDIVGIAAQRMVEYFNLLSNNRN